MENMYADVAEQTLARCRLSVDHVGISTFSFHLCFSLMSVGVLLEAALDLLLFSIPTHWLATRMSTQLTILTPLPPHLRTPTTQITIPIPNRRKTKSSMLPFICLLMFRNKHNFLDLHLIEDVVSFDSLAHRHEFISHEATSYQ